MTEQKSGGQEEALAVSQIGAGAPSVTMFGCDGNDVRLLRRLAMSPTIHTASRHVRFRSATSESEKNTAAYIAILIDCMASRFHM